MTRSRTASLLAALAGVVVLLRVVSATMRTLSTGGAGTLLTVATALLLLAALGFIAAATAFVLAPDNRLSRTALVVALVVFVLVMAGYLAVGWALATVPWTAYAVLVAVAVLGGGAVVLRREVR